MRNAICTTSCLLFLALIPIMAQNQVSDTIKYRLASVDEAKQLTVAEDIYVNNWSPFDISSRLQNINGKKEELIKRATEEVREWTKEEELQITKMMVSMNDTIRKYGYKIPFPEEIILVKTTMQSEGGAGGFTRSNWIALSDRFCTDLVETFRPILLLHETFHILSRYNPEFRKQMYEVIGFTISPEELEYPKDILNQRISNPDVERYDSYATFTIDGKKQKCAMILYSARPYSSGMFFEYMKTGFVPLDDELKAIQDADTTIVYPLEKISDFYDVVGKNTRYIIHPEEIMADNFVIGFFNQQSIPTPELKEKVRKVLTQSSK